MYVNKDGKLITDHQACLTMTNEEYRTFFDNYIPTITQSLAMKWHLILMIVWSLLYIAWKIYLYSTSIEVTYRKPSTGKMCDFKRWKSRIKYYIEGYFKWYGLKHFKTILIVWIIYGGFFIW